MPSRTGYRSLLLLGLSLVPGACGPGANDDSAGARLEPDAGAAADSPVASEPVDSAEALSSQSAAELTPGDVEAFERGFAKEIELVRAAKARGLAATTPEERGRAALEEWAEQTAPGGAQAAGLAPERYWEIRETVTTILETLDLKGEIEGPMELNLELATPEMRRRVESDPFAALSPASAAALRDRLDRLAPLWSEYHGLGAQAG
jgi:hypothetical protein